MWLTVLLLWVAIGSATTGVVAPQPSPSSSLEADNTFSLTFQQFKHLHGKKYVSTAEETYRQNLFQLNMERLKAHNANPNKTYSMSPNSFLDVSLIEFKTSFTNTRPSDAFSKKVSFNYTSTYRAKCHRECSNTQQTKSLQQNSTPLLPIQTQELHNIFDQTSHVRRLLVEESLNISKGNSSINNSIQPNDSIFIDWSMFGGPIRYQGYCGACYAFTTVDTVAAHRAIRGLGFFIPLSIQQIIDCVGNGLTYGCSGGYLEGALSYIQMEGVVTDDVYPYVSAATGKPGTCRIQGGPFKINSFQPLAQGDCSSLVGALRNGPVSVGIAAINMQFYSSGVFTDCDSSLDHAVIVVGYQSGVGWYIKNSWGQQWGLNGYGWVAEGNTCGICNMAVTLSIQESLPTTTGQ